MDIYVYSDESGVFDYVHNDYFIFGGIICVGKEARDNYSRKYRAAEKVIKQNYAGRIKEIKATTVTHKEKGKLFRSLNGYYKFGAVISQKKISRQIFSDKKTKQRYQDYAYKIALKNAILCLHGNGALNINEIDNIWCFVDEHTTATNGRYELEEGLLAEFKLGTHNFCYNTFYPPIIPRLKGLTVEFCNSEKKLLVRAADIVANKIYTTILTNGLESLNNIPNIYIKYFP